MNKWYNINIISRIYVLSMTLFLCFRLILFFYNFDKVGTDIFVILEAFWIGLRFDFVICGYLLILPFLVLSMMMILNFNNKRLVKGIFYFVSTVFTIAFFISAADIPYFNQFFSRFSMNAFLWMDNPVFMFKMITQESKYFIISIPFIVFLFFFYWQLNKIFSLQMENSSSKLYIKITISIIGLLFIFIGIRGRLQKKSPIRVGTAYFSDNSFLNQLGLNPVFTLIRSYLDSIDEKNKSIQLLDNTAAISNVQHYLGIDKPYDSYSPISRLIHQDSTKTANKYNVVIVIMESMSAAKMGRHGNKLGLTPFLDSLSNHSYYFENIYTAGKHTFNGIFSTLHSFPSLFNQHPMKDINSTKYNGIANVLKKFGYSTTYFTTHDGQFDNVEGFLIANDFEKVFSQINYPFKEIKTTLGVPDDYMFRYAIPEINKLEAKKKPFLVSFMTASDHGPFYVPEYFKAKNEEKTLKTVEYADWSIRQFITNASKQTWFANTIFVFVADHGAPIKTVYDISLDYHHSPLLIYAPQILNENKTFNCIGGQIDVFPTIMGLLNQTYVNNTLGIDLLKEVRPYIFINDDDKFGVLDNENLLIVKNNMPNMLYKYKNDDKKNYNDSNPKLASQMEIYAKSNLQTFQYISLKNQNKIK